MGLAQECGLTMLPGGTPATLCVWRNSAASASDQCRSGRT